MKEKINSLLIDVNSSLLDALFKMDNIHTKLLIVTKDNKFNSLISVGDVQRAIIKGVDIKSKLDIALRASVKICTQDESKETVKEKMLAYRCEFMPVVNHLNELVHVYFWDELISKEENIEKTLKLPVVIMAGGKGTRLKPITNIIPKPLVPIGEKAIMEVIIDSFNKLGCEKFYCSVNYKFNMIEQYFSNKQNNYSIEYFQEDFPMGTAGSLSLLKEKIKSTFFVSNCDILIDDDYTEIYKFHQKHQYELTIVAAIKNYKIPYGTLEISENGKLENLEEKPDLTFFVNTGMYILEAHLLEEIPDDKIFHITELFEKIKKRGGKIGVFPVSEGAWMDIGNWQEYNKTQDAFKNRFK
jgi:dTDP-glucose pyrophosphorylase